LAFGAGLLTFASPCVLPLVPAYLGHLTGAASRLDGPSATRRWSTLLHALGFVLGFSLVFTVLGASVGLLGYLLHDLLPAFNRVGGLILIAFGLHTMGLLRIPSLWRELRLEASPSGRWAVVSSFLAGAIFAAAWTPCVGPVLSGILILAGSSGTAARGGLLLFAYSLGLGVPFLLAAMPLGRSSVLFRQLKRHGRAVSVVSGLLLVVTGVLVFTDTLSMLSGYLGRYFAPPL
jgi:cytochrome c-type biogenesis protein